VEWSQLLGLNLVRVLFLGGPWSKDEIQKQYEEISKMREIEGYVVRTLDGFSYSQFRKNVGKFVRAQHVRTSHHWKFERIEKNLLIS